VSSIKVSISGTGSETGVSRPNLYLDDVSVKLYERDLSWVPTAEQRIDFFRKVAVDFDVQTPGADKIEVKMTKNHFPFGATFHHQMIEEMSDYKNWFDVFNFGVARNAMKWKQQEKLPGVIDWTKSDDINDVFFQQSTPLRGHTIAWSVDKNVQDWLLEIEDMDVLHDYMMKRVDDIVFRYLGNITDWDIFNEVHHGDFFRRNLGIEIWSEVLDRLDAIAPGTGQVMNDYQLTREDHGACFLDLITPIVDRLDAVGLQSHFKKQVNSQVWNRLNLLAGENLQNRLLITELDVDNVDVEVRGTDITDIIKMTFSHPNVDGIILWGWLQEVQRAWQDEAENKRKVLFVDNLGDLEWADPIVPKPDDCDEFNVVCNYPMNPNSAGVKYLEMIKKEFNTTTGHENVDELGLVRLDEAVKLFPGEYEVRVIDAEGNLIEEHEIDIPWQKDACSALQVVEFEDLSALESNSIYEFAGNFNRELDSDNGFVKNALSVSGRTAAWNSVKFNLGQILDSTEVVSSFWVRVGGTEAVTLKITLQSESGYSLKTTYELENDEESFKFSIFKNNNRIL